MDLHGLSLLKANILAFEILAHGSHRLKFNMFTIFHVLIQFVSPDSTFADPRGEGDDAAINRAACLPNGTREQCQANQLFGGVHDVAVCMSGNIKLKILYMYSNINLLLLMP